MTVKFRDATLKQLQELHDLIPNVHPTNLDDIEEWIINEKKAFFYSQEDGWRFFDLNYKPWAKPEGIR